MVLPTPTHSEPSLIFFFFSALIYADLPYGIGMADWDVAMTYDELVLMLAQVMIINTAQFHTLVLWVGFDQMALTTKAMKDSGYVAVHPVFHNKIDANFPQSCHVHLSCVEVMLWGYKTKSGTFGPHLRMPQNLHERQGIFNGPSKKVHDKNADGTVINHCEKIEWLSELVAKRTCPHNSRALVLGSGAGGDVRGLMNAGLDIVCIEKDTKQVGSMVRLLRTYEPKVQLHLEVNNYRIRQYVQGEADRADIAETNCTLCPADRKEGLEMTKCPDCTRDFCKDHFPEFGVEEGICEYCRARRPEPPVAEEPEVEVVAVAPPAEGEEKVEKEANSEPV